MIITDFKHPRLSIPELIIGSGEFWCFYGSSRSGINEFLALLEGKLSLQTETLELSAIPAIISFSIQQDIFEDEIRNDDSDFIDMPDPGTLAHEFLPPNALDNELINAFDLRGALQTGYRQLSSGQSRKLLLLKAILGGATTIVLDSPYDGLDPLACTELDQACMHMNRTGLRILVLVRNVEDIPGWCDKLAIFERGTLSHQGPRAEIIDVAKNLDTTADTLFQINPLHQHKRDSGDARPPILLELKDGFARYGERNIFTGLNFCISEGQHTLVTGPNGCGKSTLLHILTGDNPNCYGNNLHIFGRQRGTGESIWEIKKHMGIVSPEIHRNYRVPGNALQAVLSGLFDSIGLYKQVTALQKRDATLWLAAIDMVEHAETPFRQLSYGDQRLVLIARALIKQPPLLILDEPTQGLDSAARRSLLDFLEIISRDKGTTILYVSHRQDEYRSFFQQHLWLGTYRNEEGKS